MNDTQLNQKVTPQSSCLYEEEGEISVDVASGDIDGLTGLLCQAIATKLMQDGQFQEDLMEMLDKDEEGDDG